MKWFRRTDQPDAGRRGSPRPPRRWPQIAAVLLVAVCAVAATLGGLTVTGASWTDQELNPGTSVLADSLGGASGVTISSASTRCNPIAVSWTAATAPVDNYRVERSINGAAWVVMVEDAGNVTSWNEPATNHDNETVQYRITAKLAGTSWESSTIATSNTLQCGVTDLALTQPCTKVVLNWTASNAATTYDVQRATNIAGPWTAVANNVAAVTYTDATALVLGTTYYYQVRPGIGAGGNGVWSNMPSIVWSSFRVTNIGVANGGVAGTLDGGDTVTVTFSKAVATATVTNKNSIYVGNGGTKYLYTAATTTANYQIGRSTLNNPGFSASSAYAGNGVWNAPNNTILTWTKNAGAGSTNTNPMVQTAWTRSTTVRCAADNTVSIATTAPAVAGQW